MKFAGTKEIVKSIIRVLIGSSVMTASMAVAQVHGPVLDLSSAITVGSGCDRDSASVSSFMDEYGNSVLIVNYDRLGAGIDQRLTAKRLNCSMRVKTYLPAGKRLRIISAVAHGYSENSGSVSAVAAMQIWLHGESVALVQKNISSRLGDMTYFDLDKNFASGEAEIQRSAYEQPGILGIDGVVNVQSSSSRGSSAQVEISSIELTYRVD